LIERPNAESLAGKAWLGSWRTLGVVHPPKSTASNRRTNKRCWFLTERTPSNETSGKPDPEEWPVVPSSLVVISTLCTVFFNLRGLFQERSSSADTCWSRPGWRRVCGPQSARKKAIATAD